MLTTFSFGFLQIYHSKRALLGNSENYRHTFSWNNPSTVGLNGLFCYDKFEETPNEKMVNMSELTKPYFRYKYCFQWDYYNGYISFLINMVTW